MNFTRIVGVAIGTAGLVAASPLAPASAVNNIKDFGVQETLKDFYSLGDFSSEIGYTVNTLRPSSDPVVFPVAGRLYESDVTATSVVGTVFPQGNNFRARTPGGGDYGALPVSTLNGAPLGPGGSVSGKVYYDVVGENPDSVIFNKDFQDLLGWVGQQPAGPVGSGIVPGTDSSGGTSPGGAEAGGESGAPEPSSGPGLAQPPEIPTGGAGAPVQSEPPASN